MIIKYDAVSITNFPLPHPPSASLGTTTRHLLKGMGRRNVAEIKAGGELNERRGWGREREI